MRITSNWTLAYKPKYYDITFTCYSCVDTTSRIVNTFIRPTFQIENINIKRLFSKNSKFFFRAFAVIKYLRKWAERYLCLAEFLLLWWSLTVWVSNYILNYQTEHNTYRKLQNWPALKYSDSRSFYYHKFSITGYIAFCCAWIQYMTVSSVVTECQASHLMG